MKGLTNEEVIINRNKYGSNEIIGKKEKKFINLLIESLGDPMIKILLVALVIKIIFSFKEFDYFDTIGIFLAIILSTLISSISEYGSNKAFEKLGKETNNIKVKVKRNDSIIEINIDDIVVNDLILLEAGDKIGADGYLINGELSVNESILNGEIKEQKKKVNSLLYRGTTIYSGYGIMKVSSVGMNTMYGKLALEITKEDPISPLRNRLVELAKIISRIGYIGAFLVTFSYLFSKIVIANNYDLDIIKRTICDLRVMMNYLIYALTLSVTVIVVAVPEGLPMMITLVLSSNMKKMLKNKVLVRKLVGIETAGNINVLLTDKTGTITKGSLEVIKVLDGNLTYLSKHQIYKSAIIFDALYYNNDSIIDNKLNIIGGNSTDRAILHYLNKKVDIKKNVLNIKHFNSYDKYSSCEVNTITYYKGASEILLPKCTKYYNGKNEVLLKNYDFIEKEINKATDLGIRVLMLAYKKDNKFNDLVFMGLIYLKDEIREEAYQGINLIKKAGIDVIMITGDSLKTAKTIGKQLNILDNDSLILESNDLKKMTDQNIKDNLKKIKIIARALPEDKSRLVRVIEDMNLIVGMTGDGVNDAPALRQANVGFSMGTGSEVAKEASDIVILDNNILSISKAILYGRTIFKSIRKFIIYQLSVNMCALVLSIVGPFIGFTSPITIVQMLWLNMIMDTFSAVAFSFEPALIEYMEELPKKVNEKIINSYMYNEIILSSIYSALICILFLKLPIIKIIFRVGDNNKYLMTAYFALFIFLGIFNSFNARTYRINIFSNILKNKVFLFIISFIIIIQIYLIYFGGNIFRTYGLEAHEFFLVIIIALSVWPIDIIRKLLLKKFNFKRKV